MTIAHLIVISLSSIIANEDYIPVSTTLIFEAGVTEVTFTVDTVDNLISELTETFTVTLSNPSGASVGATSTATVNINDNDCKQSQPCTIYH